MLTGTGTDTAAFLHKAVDWVNACCFGSLCCAIMVHPKTEKRYAREFDEAIQNLEYGCITINCPTHLGYAVTSLPWGAFPKQRSRREIGSGVGMVHNTFMFDHPQKGVLRAPWRFVPKPFWFARHTNIDSMAPAVGNFVEASEERRLTATRWLLQAAAADSRG